MVVPFALRPMVGVVVGVAAVVAAVVMADRSRPDAGAFTAVLTWTLLAWGMNEFVSDGRGWIAHALAVLLEWQLLQMSYSLVPACLIVQTAPRAAVVVLAWISRPAAEAPPRMDHLTSIGAGLAIVQGIIVASLAGWLAAALIVCISYLIVRLARTWAYRTAGGVSQNSLAYTRLAVEVAVLLALVSAPLPEAYQRFGAR